MTQLPSIARPALVCGIIGIALAGALPGFAQSTPLPGVPGGKNITCREFLRLGTARENEVVYFANGYAAGVEDQIAAGTPSTPGNTPATTSDANTSINRLAPNASPVAPLKSLSNLADIDLDQLRAVCRTALSATVLSKVPGGSPAAGSGTITGSVTSSGSSDESGSTVMSGAVTDTTASSVGAASAGITSAAAAPAPSVHLSVVDTPSTGLEHIAAQPAAPAAAPAMQMVQAPVAGRAPGGVAVPSATTSTGTTGAAL